MRDIPKRVEEGKAIVRKHKNADLKLSEIQECYKIFNDKESKNGGLFGVIETAFYLGASVGARYGNK